VNSRSLISNVGIAGGSKKRVGGRAMDAALLPQSSAVSSISLAHSGSDAAAYSSNLLSGNGGRTGAAYPSQINYSGLSVQTNTLPSGHSRIGSTQPSQLNFALQVHPSNIPSSHSGIGTRTGSTQRAQVDLSSVNNDRLIIINWMIFTARCTIV